MRVLLTGATGFVGSHLARLLVHEGLEVHAMIRPGEDTRRVADVLGRLQVVQGDLQAAGDPERVVHLVRPELCIHLAWYAEPGKYLTSPLNIDLLHASARFAAAAAASGCSRFLGVGTCFEYDTALGTLREDSLLRPQHLYSAAKAALYVILEQIGAQAGMQVVWARLFYLYGPFEDPRRLVASVTGALLRGERVPTTKGEQIRDFLHVSDVAAALWSIARSGLTGPINVGSGQAVTVRQVVETIASITERSHLVDWGALPYGARDPMFVRADCRRLRSETDWSPRFDLTSGLADTVAWWRSRLGSVGGGSA